MQRKGPPRDAAKERFWRRVIRQQGHSRQSIRAYCRARGLTEASFYAWRRELACREEQAPGVVRGRRQRLQAVREKGGRGASLGSNGPQRGGRRPRRSRRALGEAAAFVPVVNRNGDAAKAPGKTGME